MWIWTLEYGRKYRKLHYKRISENIKRWCNEHRKHLKEQRMIWREKNREVLRERANRWLRQHRKEWKLEVIKKYGGKCDCCGIKDIEFLTIDHIKGNGKAERKKLNSTYAIYRKLHKNPINKNEYRILCMNCNFATRLGNICPHKKRINTKQEFEKKGGE